METKLQLIQDNFEAHISKIPSLHPKMYLFNSKSLVFVDSGLSEDTFNVVHIKNGDTIDIEEIKNAIDYYKSQNFSFCIWVSKENLTVSLKEIFDKLLLSKQAEELGMILDLESYIFTDNDDKISIIKANTDKTLLDYADVIASHWSPTNENILQYYKNSRHIYFEETHGIFLFVYYYQAQPVATIELFATDEETIGIYGLTTLEEFRGKGIGTSLLKYAIGFAKQKSYKQVVLQATEDGFSIYKQLGFKVLTKYFEYS